MKFLLPLLSHFACSANQVSLSGTCNGTGLPTVSAGHDQLVQILQLVIGIIAAVAVLFVVIGGFRFVISEGDPQSTAKARSTIVYAVVGLIIAVSAEALVTFVLGKI